MNIPSTIQDASPTDWSSALQAGFSQSKHPLWEVIQSYASGNIKEPSASQTLNAFTASLQHNNSDQLLTNFYTGLAAFFPKYIQSEAWNTPRYGDLGNGNLGTMTNIILNSEVQVEKILFLQKHIKERFTKFEQSCLPYSDHIKEELKVADHTTYISKMIRLSLDYNCVDILPIM